MDDPNHGTHASEVRGNRVIRSYAGKDSNTANHGYPVYTDRYPEHQRSSGKAPTKELREPVLNNYRSAALFRRGYDDVPRSGTPVLRNYLCTNGVFHHRDEVPRKDTPRIRKYTAGAIGHSNNNDVPNEGERIVNTCEPEDFIGDMMSKVNSSVGEEEKRRLKCVLEENKDVFSLNEFDIGRTGLVKHFIDTGDARPFRQQLRRHPMAHLQAIDDQVDILMKTGMASPSMSPWASNVVLVKKSDGSLRFCIDYRQLNSITVKDSFPLPRIDTCFDALAGAKYFSSLDLRSGYWQVENDPATADKTTFITRRGAFKFNVLPFGLSNAPAIFQRLMNLVLQGLTWEACLVFLDDILVMSTTFDEHLERLRAVFDRLRSANLKLKPSKCKLLQERVKFLGSVVSAAGIEPDPEKVRAVEEWPIPQNLTELRAFTGLAGYYRRFIEGFSTIAKPLSELTAKDVPFVWTERQQTAFDTLKRKLVSSPILAPPTESGMFTVDTDASNYAMGAVLQQEQEGQLRVIAYASQTFQETELNYCTTRKELAAIIFALKEFSHYLTGRKRFVLRTDHGALTSLFKAKEPVSQQARYLGFLAEFNFEVQHRAGVLHGNSDGLSRRRHTPCTDKRCTRPEQCKGQPHLPPKGGG